MTRKKQFITEFFKSDDKPVGSLAGSWPKLVRTMCGHLDPTRKLDVLELGMGTGAVTKGILKRLSPDSRLLGIELNEKFAPILEKSFAGDKRLKLEIGSAFEMERIARENGFDGFDAIISSLPLTLLEENDRERILRKTVSLMNPGCTFVQYQYSMHEYDLYNKVFDQVELKIVLLNLPPAFVYYCRP